MQKLIFYIIQNVWFNGRNCESSEESNLIQYNLAELGLEEYESKENVHELKLFFGNKSHCKCRNENKICFEKIGFKKDTWN